MDVRETANLIKKYSPCPECGNDSIGGTPIKGFLVIEEETFHKGCHCGWEVKVDRRIKCVGPDFITVNGKAKEKAIRVHIYNVGEKLVPAKELKQRAGVRMISQVEKLMDYANTPEGREWIESLE